MFSPWLLKALGDRGVRALERLMGMLLVLIAVEIFFDGVRAFYATLGSDAPVALP